MKQTIKSTLFFCLLLISSSPSMCMQQCSADKSNAWYNGLAIGTAIGSTAAAAGAYLFYRISVCPRIAKLDAELKKSKRALFAEVQGVEALRAANNRLEWERNSANESATDAQKERRCLEH